MSDLSLIKVVQHKQLRKAGKAEEAKKAGFWKRPDFRKYASGVPSRTTAKIAIPRTTAETKPEQPNVPMFDRSLTYGNNVYFDEELKRFTPDSTKTPVYMINDTKDPSNSLMILGKENAKAAGKQYKVKASEMVFSEEVELLFKAMENGSFDEPAATKDPVTNKWIVSDYVDLSGMTPEEQERELDKYEKKGLQTITYGTMTPEQQQQAQGVKLSVEEKNKAKLGTFKKLLPTDWYVMSKYNPLPAGAKTVWVPKMDGTEGELEPILINDNMASKLTDFSDFVNNPLYTAADATSMRSPLLYLMSQNEGARFLGELIVKPILASVSAVPKMIGAVGETVIDLFKNKEEPRALSAIAAENINQRFDVIGDTFINYPQRVKAAWRDILNGDDDRVTRGDKIILDMSTNNSMASALAGAIDPELKAFQEGYKAEAKQFVEDGVAQSTLLRTQAKTALMNGDNDTAVELTRQAIQYDWDGNIVLSGGSTLSDISKYGTLGPYEMWTWEYKPERKEQFLNALALAELQQGSPLTISQVNTIKNKYVDNALEMSGDIIFDPTTYGIPGILDAVGQGLKGIGKGTKWVIFDPLVSFLNKIKISPSDDVLTRMIAEGHPGRVAAELAGDSPINRLGKVLDGSFKASTYKEAEMLVTGRMGLADFISAWAKTPSISSASKKLFQKGYKFATRIADWTGHISNRDKRTFIELMEDVGKYATNAESLSTAVKSGALPPMSTGMQKLIIDITQSVGPENFVEFARTADDQIYKAVRNETTVKLNKELDNLASKNEVAAVIRNKWNALQINKTQFTNWANPKLEAMANLEMIKNPGKYASRQAAIDAFKSGVDSNSEEILKKLQKIYYSEEVAREAEKMAMKGQSYTERAAAVFSEELKNFWLKQRDITTLWNTDIPTDTFIGWLYRKNRRLFDKPTATGAQATVLRKAMVELRDIYQKSLRFIFTAVLSGRPGYLFVNWMDSNFRALTYGVKLWESLDDILKWHELDGGIPAAAFQSLNEGMLGDPNKLTYKIMNRLFKIEHNPLTNYRNIYTYKWKEIVEGIKDKQLLEAGLMKEQEVSSALNKFARMFTLPFKAFIQTNTQFNSLTEIAVRAKTYHHFYMRNWTATRSALLNKVLDMVSPEHQELIKSLLTMSRTNYVKMSNLIKERDGALIFNLKVPEAVQKVFKDTMSPAEAEALGGNILRQLEDILTTNKDKSYQEIGTMIDQYFDNVADEYIKMVDDKLEYMKRLQDMAFDSDTPADAQAALKEIAETARETSTWTPTQAMRDAEEAIANGEKIADENIIKILDDAKLKYDKTIAPEQNLKNAIKQADTRKLLEYEPENFLFKNNRNVEVEGNLYKGIDSDFSKANTFGYGAEAQSIITSRRALVHRAFDNAHAVLDMNTKEGLELGRKLNDIHFMTSEMMSRVRLFLTQADSSLRWVDRTGEDRAAAWMAYENWMIRATNALMERIQDVSDAILDGSRVVPEFNSLEFLQDMGLKLSFDERGFISRIGFADDIMVGNRTLSAIIDPARIDNFRSMLFGTTDTLTNDFTRIQTGRVGMPLEQIGTHYKLANAVPIVRTNITVDEILANENVYKPIAKNNLKEAVENAFRYVWNLPQKTYSDNYLRERLVRAADGPMSSRISAALSASDYETMLSAFEGDTGIRELFELVAKAGNKMAEAGTPKVLSREAKRMKDVYVRTFKDLNWSTHEINYALSLLDNMSTMLAPINGMSKNEWLIKTIGAITSAPVNLSPVLYLNDVTGDVIYHSPLADLLKTRLTEKVYTGNQLLQMIDNGTIKGLRKEDIEFAHVTEWLSDASNVNRKITPEELVEYVKANELYVVRSERLPEIASDVEGSVTEFDLHAFSRLHPDEYREYVYSVDERFPTLRQPHWGFNADAPAPRAVFHLRTSVVDDANGGRVLVFDEGQSDPVNQVRELARQINWNVYEMLGMAERKAGNTVPDILDDGADAWFSSKLKDYPGLKKLVDSKGYVTDNVASEAYSDWTKLQGNLSMGIDRRTSTSAVNEIVNKYKNTEPKVFKGWPRDRTDATKLFVDNRSLFFLYKKYVTGEIKNKAFREEVKALLDASRDVLDFDAVVVNMKRILSARNYKYPFKTNYERILAKEAIKIARKEGITRVAWTTGEQQVQRYGNLILEWATNEDGTRSLWLASKNGSKKRLLSDNIQSFTDILRMPHELSRSWAETIWKNMKDAPSGSYVPLERGMKDAYDKSLTDIMGKLGKDFDSTPSMETLRVSPGKLSYEVEENKYTGKWEVWEKRPGRERILVHGFGSKEQAENSMLEVKLMNNQTTQEMHIMNIPPEMQVWADDVNPLAMNTLIGLDENLERAAKTYFGVTDDIHSAGYILQDGTFLDLGVKSLAPKTISGETPGLKVPHDDAAWLGRGKSAEQIAQLQMSASSEVFRVDTMRRTGMLRQNYDAKTIEIASPLSAEQMQQLTEWYTKVDEITHIDIRLPDGTLRTRSFANANRAEVRQILNSINDSFASTSSQMLHMDDLSWNQYLKEQMPDWKTPPSKEDLTRLTDTENFKKWFRDSVTKSEDGSIKMYYHGTGNYGFPLFNRVYNDPKSLYGPGFYFTELPKLAQDYVKKGTKFVYKLSDNAVDNTRSFIVDQIKKQQRELTAELDQILHKTFGTEITIPINSTDVIKRELDSYAALPDIYIPTKDDDILKIFGTTAKDLADSTSDTFYNFIMQDIGYYIRSKRTLSRLDSAKTTAETLSNSKLSEYITTPNRFFSLLNDLMEGHFHSDLYYYLINNEYKIPTPSGVYDVFIRTENPLRWNRLEEVDKFMKKLEKHVKSPAFNPDDFARSISVNRLQMAQQTKMFERWKDFYTTLRERPEFIAEEVDLWLANVIGDDFKNSLTDIAKVLGYDSIIHTGGRRVGAGEVIHEVVIPFSSTQIKSIFNDGTFSETGWLLHLKKGSNRALGSMGFLQDARAIIQLSHSAKSPLVFAHELAHVALPQVAETDFDALASWAVKTKQKNVTSQLSHAQFKTLHEKVWITKTATAAETALYGGYQEAFANGFVKYLSEPKTSLPETLRKFYDKIRDSLINFFNSYIKGTDLDVKLNKEMRDMYSRLIGAPPVGKETLTETFTDQAKRIKKPAGAVALWPNLDYMKAKIRKEFLSSGVPEPDVDSLVDMYIRDNQLLTADSLAEENEKAIEKYVEEPAQDLVRRLMGEGKEPISSNAYGPGAKGVWWTDLEDTKGFTPLEVVEEAEKVVPEKAEQNVLWQSVIEKNNLRGYEGLTDMDLATPEAFIAALQKDSRRWRARPEGQNIADTIDRLITKIERELNILGNITSKEKVVVTTVPDIKLKEGMTQFVDLSENNVRQLKQMIEVLKEWKIGMQSNIGKAAAGDTDAWFMTNGKAFWDEMDNLSPTISKELETLKDVLDNGGTYEGINVDGALRRTNEILIDYTTQFAWENIPRTIFPFWTFPTRSIPFWAKTMVMHPELLNYYMKYLMTNYRSRMQGGMVNSNGEPLDSLFGYVRVPGTDYWFNPTAPLSFRILFPSPYEGYNNADEETTNMSPMSSIFRNIYEVTRLRGISMNPYALPIARAAGWVSEKEAPRYSVIPQLDLVPRFWQRAVMEKIRQTVFPNAPELWTPDVTYKDLLIETMILKDTLQRMEELKRTAITDENYEAQAYSMVQKVSDMLQLSPAERNKDPLWIKWRTSYEAEQTFKSWLGWGTNIYYKKYTNGDAEFNALRNRLNLMRAALNDETKTKLFNLSKDQLTLSTDLSKQRYNTPEGRLYSLKQSLNFVEDRYGVELEGDARRQAIADGLTKEETDSAYYDAVSAAFERAEKELQVLPIGTPYAKKQAIYDRLNKEILDAEETYKREDSAFSVYNKSPETLMQKFESEWWKIIKLTEPTYDSDIENYATFEKRHQEWEAQLPQLAATVSGEFKKKVTSQLTTLFGEDQVAVDGLVNLLIQNTTAEGLATNRLQNDTAYDALTNAWVEIYLKDYYEAVEDKSNEEYMLAEREFKREHPQPPTFEELSEWIMSTYGASKFTLDELKAAYDGTEVNPLSIEENQKESRDEKETIREEIFTYREMVASGNASDDFYRVFSGPGIGGDRDKLSLLYSNPDELTIDDLKLLKEQVKKTIGILGFTAPTTNQLVIRAQARTENEELYALIDAEMGADFRSLRAWFYRELDWKQQAAYKKANPDFAAKLEQAKEIQAAFSATHPMWAQIYGEPTTATATTGGGGGGGGGTVKKKATVTSGVGLPAPWRYEVPRNMVRMGYRTSMEANKLISGQALGKAGAGGVPQWPDEMIRELEFKVWSDSWPAELTTAMGDQMMSTLKDRYIWGTKLSDASLAFLNGLADRHPEWSDMLQDIVNTQ